MSSFEGFEGVWLRNDQAEAFVCATPYPRVLAFRLRGGESPLFVTRDFGLIGIRSRCHLPSAPQDYSQEAALQPATLHWLSDDGRSVRLDAAPDSAGSKLQLSMEISLHPSEPALRILHIFRNLADESRRLAPWAILAVPGTHTGLLPYEPGDAMERRLIHFRGLTPVQPGVIFGKQALMVDYATPPREIWYKIGTDSTAGWVAIIANGLVMRSTVAVPTGGDYPERGATTTAFKWRGGAAWQALPFGEIEHNGPWRTVAPQATFHLLQTVELHPVTVPEDTSPDGWCATISQLPTCPWEGD